MFILGSISFFDAVLVLRFNSQHLSEFGNGIHAIPSQSIKKYENRE